MEIVDPRKLVTSKAADLLGGVRNIQIRGEEVSVDGFGPERIIVFGKPSEIHPSRIEIRTNEVWLLLEDRVAARYGETGELIELSVSFLQNTLWAGEHRLSLPRRANNGLITMIESKTDYLFVIGFDGGPHFEVSEIEETSSDVVGECQFEPGVMGVFENECSYEWEGAAPIPETKIRFEIRANQVDGYIISEAGRKRIFSVARYFPIAKSRGTSTYSKMQVASLLGEAFLDY